MEMKVVKGLDIDPYFNDLLATFHIAAAGFTDAVLSLVDLGGFINFKGIRRAALQLKKLDRMRCEALATTKQGNIYIASIIKECLQEKNNRIVQVYWQEENAAMCTSRLGLPSKCNSVHLYNLDKYGTLQPMCSVVDQ